MAKKKRMTLHFHNDVTILDLGEVEIWDGADLALLRETLTQLIEVDHCRAVGVDLTYVKYIPSGFFGMLYDWHEKGVDVTLYSPQPHVRNMLWFRQFFEDNGQGEYRLHSEPKELMVPERDADWNDEAPWTGKSATDSLTPITSVRR